jgi:hypothetical protein
MKEKSTSNGHLRENGCMVTIAIRGISRPDDHE